MKPFKTKEEIDAYFFGDKIQCLICKKEYFTLGTHLLKKHLMSVDDYKEMFGLPWSKGLIALKSAEKCAKNLKRRLSEGETALIENQRNLREIQKLTHAVKRKPKQPFDLRRIVKQQKITAKKQNKKSLIKAHKIVTRMSKEKLPACYFTCNPESSIKHHTFIRQLEKNKKLREEYDVAHQNIPALIELKTGLSREQIRTVIFGLRNEGYKIREIVAEMCIGKTTVKRILYAKDSWRNSMEAER